MTLPFPPNHLNLDNAHQMLLRDKNKTTARTKPPAATKLQAAGVPKARRIVHEFPDSSFRFLTI